MPRLHFCALFQFALSNMNDSQLYGINCALQNSKTLQHMVTLFQKVLHKMTQNLVENSARVLSMEDQLSPTKMANPEDKALLMMQPACQGTRKKQGMYVSTILKAHSLHPVHPWSPLYIRWVKQHLQRSVLVLSAQGLLEAAQLWSALTYPYTYYSLRNTRTPRAWMAAAALVTTPCGSLFNQKTSETFLFVSYSSRQRKMIMLQLSFLHQRITSAQPVMAVRALCALVELNVT